MNTKITSQYTIYTQIYNPIVQIHSFSKGFPMILYPRSVKRATASHCNEDDDDLV